MHLRFLGTGAADFSPLLETELRDRLDDNARRSSSVLIEGRFLIDCGPHVLDSMGLSHRRIDSAIRLSFNAHNTEADIDAFLEKLQLGLDTLARARS